MNPVAQEHDEFTKLKYFELSQTVQTDAEVHRTQPKIEEEHEVQESEEFRAKVSEHVVQ